MRRHSVVFKLFIVTSALVLLAFLVVMAAEGLFFERFYRGTKISSLAGSMGSFAEAYGEHPDDERRVSRLLGEFMNRHDAASRFWVGSLPSSIMNPITLICGRRAGS